MGELEKERSKGRERVGEEERAGWASTRKREVLTSRPDYRSRSGECAGLAQVSAGFQISGQ